MNSLKFSIKKPESTRLWIILGGPAFVTLYFNSQMRDPFNSPKFMILLLLGFWLTGHLISSFKLFELNKNLKSYLQVLLLFVLLYFVAAIASPDKYTAFIGIYQRRNGFLMYLCLALLSLSAALFVKFSHLRRLINILLVTSLALVTYGFLQSNGKDFVNWNNPYNSVISTLGNPNFAAAVMAIFATLLFCFAFVTELGKARQSLFLITSLSFLYLIYQSNSRQGLLAFGFGLAFFFVYLSFIRTRILGFISLGLALIVSSLAIFGMLQSGPLANLLYKPSVSVRGYYWRAAIEMMRDYPIFGVGIDKYGSFFREYREIGYPLNYGFNITSTNAHNVPLQIASTGGIFLGIVYLAVNVFILTVAIKRLRTLIGSERVVYLAILSGWLAFQAQSIISIDNIGIAVWGWLLGGLLVGLGSNTTENSNSKISGKVKAKNIYDFKQITFSVLFTIPVLVYISFAYSSERDMWKQPQLIQASQGSTAEFYKLAEQTISNPFSDPVFKLETAFNLYQTNYIEEARIELDKLVSADPQNIEFLSISADFYESVKNYEKAIQLRLSIAQNDPYGAINYLKLGRLYKETQNYENQIKMLNKILSFAPLTEEAKVARAELS
jgi:O-antigen ligase